MLTLTPTRSDEAFLRDHFRPGNIVYLDYWRSFDRVIEFRVSDDGGWIVWVEEVKKVDGEWVAVAPRRCHCTHPGKRDRVVCREVGV